MAKRKRLNPVRPTGYSEQTFHKVGARPTEGLAPISAMVHEASTSAALDEITAELQQARTDGRLAVRISLDAIEENYLVRDRIEIDAQDMEALKNSLERRGQLVPIEVMELAPQRYGLISGWRRLSALKMLARENDQDLSAHTVLAIIRTPKDSAEAYEAMVEENEIRVGLSYFERARIVLRAVEGGVYPDTRMALSSLFESASRAKRSKIGSFMTIVETLEGYLKYPNFIGERLGLELSKAISDTQGFADKCIFILQEHPDRSFTEEADMLRRLLSGHLNQKPMREKITNIQLPSGLDVIERSGSVMVRGRILKDAKARRALIAFLKDYLV